LFTVYLAIATIAVSRRSRVRMQAVINDNTVCAPVGPATETDADAGSDLDLDLDAGSDFDAGSDLDLDLDAGSDSDTDVGADFGFETEIEPGPDSGSFEPHATQNFDLSSCCLPQAGHFFIVSSFPFKV
jgi:hypothetical protein